MTAAGHSITGAFLASKIPDPRIGIPLAIISHFALDLVPHWDVGTNWRKRKRHLTVIYAAIDVLLGIGLAVILFPSNNPLYLFSMIFAAQLPDLIETPYWLLDIKWAPLKIVYEIQHRLHVRAQIPLGLITQIAFVLVLLALSSSTPGQPAVAK